MPSLTNQTWNLKNAKTDVPLIERILANRSIDKLETGLEDLHNPLDLHGMKEAVDRVMQAIKTQERVMVYGDYDVDGTTASAILYQCLTKAGVNISVRLPNRHKHGYGLNKQFFEECVELNVKVVITVDTGTSAHAEADYAKDLGIDLIVTDHHLPTQKDNADHLPNAFTVVNPRLSACNYHNKELCGTAVGWKLAQAVLDQVGYDHNYALEFLDLVALSTICDVMPLVGENRAIVSLGLEQLRKCVHPGVQALIEACDINPKDLKAYHLGFVIGPCINAAGRLKSPDLAFKMLIGHTDHAPILRDINRERQEIQKTMLAEAEVMIEQQIKDGLDLTTTPLIFLYKDNWSHGIVGIIAGRLKDKYHVPTIVCGGKHAPAHGRDTPSLTQQINSKHNTPYQIGKPILHKTYGVSYNQETPNEKKDKYHVPNSIYGGGGTGRETPSLTQQINAKKNITPPKGKPTRHETSGVSDNRETQNAMQKTTHFIGSCRSIEEINVKELLDNAADIVETYGGHKGAAGFTVKAEKINEMIESLQQAAQELAKTTELEKKIHIDAEILPIEITWENLEAIQSLEPFGKGNPSPKLILRDVPVRSLRKIGKDESHLKLTLSLSALSSEHSALDAIAFRFGEHHDTISASDKIDLVCSLDRNEFRGKETLQLKVEDISL
jgi:single-stranded DNA-specific DHH superfamily exonuclease